MRDRGKYYYVEVSLPKDDEAIKRMVDESKRLHISLGLLLRQAGINAYSEQVQSRVTVSALPAQESSEASVSARSYLSANEFLDMSD